MTAHSHRTFDPTCYRCQLGLDEVRDAMAEELAESRWPGRYLGDLTYREWADLYAQVDADLDASSRTGPSTEDS